MRSIAFLRSEQLTIGMLLGTQDNARFLNFKRQVSDARLDLGGRIQVIKYRTMVRLFFFVMQKTQAQAIVFFKKIRSKLRF